MFCADWLSGLTIEQEVHELLVHQTILVI